MTDATEAANSDSNSNSEAKAQAVDADAAKQSGPARLSKQQQLCT